MHFKLQLLMLYLSCLDHIDCVSIYVWSSSVAGIIMQEAILAIGSASSPIDFRDAVMNALYFSLTNLVINHGISIPRM